MFRDGVALTLCGSRDFMRSLRGWLLILWLMLFASAAMTGYLLIGSFRQSAAAQVGRAREPAGSPEAGVYQREFDDGAAMP